MVPDPGGHMLPIVRRTRQSIVEELRRRISEGVYRPGAALPARRALAGELGTTQTTLQLACDQLAAQGFLELSGRQATRVPLRLPASSRIALVFPYDPSETGNRFWATARKLGAAWRDDTTAFEVYELGRQRQDSPGCRRLLADIAARSLAGLVFVDIPQELGGSPLFTSDLPRVVVGIYGEEHRRRYRSSVITFSDAQAVERLFRGFHAAGRRRLAILGPAAGPDWAAGASGHVALAGRLDLEVRREWQQYLPPDAVGAACARNLIHLLCAGSREHRPDCLLIADDNHVPHATAGVLDAGLRIPEDLAVAAHANFPETTRSAMPCLRYGPDMEQLLRSAIGEIGRLAAGGSTRVILVPHMVRDP